MQYNINVANGTGLDVRTNLNLAHQSLATNFFGATDPSTMSPVCAFPGSTWLDTGNNQIKVRNANDSDWIVIGTIEPDGTPKLNANGINNTPSGTISATNVQSAVNSLNVLPLLLRDTAYADDDVAFYAGLPSAMYLQCTTAGTTDTVDITIPSPVAVGDTITDGTVEWTVKKALVDITQYEQELATKANRDLSNLTQTGQDSFLERDFTIIYPNGGTEANPANVTTNNNYWETNPFTGYYVYCQVELLISGEWISVGEQTFVPPDGEMRKMGITAMQNDSNESIKISTGTSCIFEPSNLFNSAVGTPATTYTAPCRVKVWKIGKVANNA